MCVFTVKFSSFQTLIQGIHTDITRGGGRIVQFGSMIQNCGEIFMACIAFLSFIPLGLLLDKFVIVHG